MITSDYEPLNAHLKSCVILDNQSSYFPSISKKNRFEIYDMNIKGEGKKIQFEFKFTNEISGPGTATLIGQPRYLVGVPGNTR